MTKTKLISSLGGAVAASLLTAPSVQASENPFSMQKVSNATQLAEAMDKDSEGKCGEGKCGDKAKDGTCSGKMEKSKDGKCGEGKCGDNAKGKMEKSKEGQCGDKMKEGGCNGTVDAPEE